MLADGSDLRRRRFARLSLWITVVIAITLALADIESVQLIWFGTALAEETMSRSDWALILTAVAVVILSAAALAGYCLGRPRRSPLSSGWRPWLLACGSSVLSIVVLTLIWA